MTLGPGCPVVLVVGTGDGGACPNVGAVAQREGIDDTAESDTYRENGHADAFE